MAVLGDAAAVVLAVMDDRACCGVVCHQASFVFALLLSTAVCAGKRTIGGLLDDGVKSIVRYYLNNFQVRLPAALLQAAGTLAVCQ
jgi:hypothetical protein